MYGNKVSNGKRSIGRYNKLLLDTQHSEDRIIWQSKYDAKKYRKDMRVYVC